jgi:hypothetical protein
MDDLFSASLYIILESTVDFFVHSRGGGSVAVSATWNVCEDYKKLNDIAFQCGDVLFGLDYLGLEADCRTNASLPMTCSSCSLFPRTSGWWDLARSMRRHKYEL